MLGNLPGKSLIYSKLPKNPSKIPVVITASPVFGYSLLFHSLSYITQGIYCLFFWGGLTQTSMCALFKASICNRVFFVVDQTTNPGKFQILILLPGVYCFMLKDSLFLCYQTQDTLFYSFPSSGTFWTLERVPFYTTEDLLIRMKI